MLFYPPSEAEPPNTGTGSRPELQRLASSLAAGTERMRTRNVPGNWAIPPAAAAETCIGFFDYRLEAVGEGGSIEPVDEVDEVDEVESTPNTPSAPSATSNTEPIRLETLEEQP